MFVRLVSASASLNELASAYGTTFPAAADKLTTEYVLHYRQHLLVDKILCHVLEFGLARTARVSNGGWGHCALMKSDELRVLVADNSEVRLVLH